MGAYPVMYSLAYSVIISGLFVNDIPRIGPLVYLRRRLLINVFFWAQGDELV